MSFEHIPTQKKEFERLKLELANFVQNYPELPDELLPKLQDIIAGKTINTASLKLDLLTNHTKDPWGMELFTIIMALESNEIFSDLK